MSENVQSVPPTVNKSADNHRGLQIWTIQPTHQQDIPRLLTQMLTEITVKDRSGGTQAGLLVVRAGSLKLILGASSASQSRV